MQGIRYITPEQRKIAVPKLGPYSKEIILAHPDRRTKEGRLLAQMRAALYEQLGGEDRVNPLQRAMIERAAMLQLRCATLDRRILDGTFTEYDAKTYLAFSNSLTRVLRILGLDARSAPKPTNLLAKLAHAAGETAA